MPFPKVSRKSGTFSQAASGERTEDDLLRLQKEWVERYRARVHAYQILGISLGTPLDEIEDRYRVLKARLPQGDRRREAIEAAFQLVLATSETSSIERSEAAGASGGAHVILAAVGVPTSIPPIGLPDETDRTPATDSADDDAELSDNEDDSADDDADQSLD